jgi:uncharacterized coiled-coil DUF342 family protein
MDQIKNKTQFLKNKLNEYHLALARLKAEKEELEKKAKETEEELKEELDKMKQEKEEAERKLETHDDEEKEILELLAEAEKTTTRIDAQILAWEPKK